MQSMFFIGSKYNFEFSEIKNVRYHHNIAMDAENKIGYLLEEYIYQNIRDNGWILVHRKYFTKYRFY